MSRGWWADSLDETIDTWRGCEGVHLDYDGRVDGRRFAYVAAEALGIRFEAVDTARRKAIDEAWPIED